MATYFLDYEGGNDANDGLSFANRWKTITSGATAARIAPGDTIKVMGSPDPTSLGINATWTNKSATVTLASALNVLITDCETAWTASANVTSTADTSVYRTTSKSAKHVIAAGFTTGKVAYFDLGSNQDYSAYQGVTFWVSVAGVTLAAGVLTLDLCSDTVGATPVNTIAIPAISQVGQWIPVYVDKAAGLGASIRSISINAISDPGALTLYLDNISTVKAAGANCLHLNTLLGKNTAGEYWWAIRGISGTTITLDHSPAATATSASRGYYGSTGSVATYIRTTTKTDLVAATTTVAAAIQDSGTAGNLITFSGGWDRTNMSTQSLEATWYDGQSGFGYGLYGNAKTYISLSKINFVRYYRGLYIDANPGNWTIGDIYFGNNTAAGLYINGGGSYTFAEVHVWGSCNEGGITTINGDTMSFTKIRLISIGVTGSVVSGYVPVNHYDWSITEMECSNCAWYGWYGASTGSVAQYYVGTLTCKDNGQGGMWGAISSARMEIDSLVLTSNGGVGATMSGVDGYIRIGAVTSTNNTSHGFTLSTPGNIDLVIRNLTTSGNAFGFHSSVLSGKTVILNSSLAEASKWSADSLSLAGFGSVSFRNFNGTAGDHRTMFNGGYSITGLGAASLYSETSIRHTASGIAWRLMFGAHQYGGSVRFPIIVPVARYAVNAGSLVTQSLWVRRNHLNVSGTLRIKGGQIGGVAADVSDTISVAVDTWEQLTITFTPSETGTVEIELTGYASDALFSNTRYLYFDDESHSQA